MAMVRSSVLSSPKIVVQTCQHLHTPALTLTHSHVLTSSNPPQTGPVVGISFCLIIARLGQILPEVQDETWHVSLRAPASRTPASGQAALPLAQAGGKRDVYVDELKDLPTGTSESQKQEFTNSSGGLPTIFPTSPSLSSASG